MKKQNDKFLFSESYVYVYVWTGKANCSASNCLFDNFIVVVVFCS